ncbi:MAG: hypothetical protein ACI3U1_00530, partial [Peptococcaceae bacterium]
MKKKVMSCILILAMVLSLLPVTAFADGDKCFICGQAEGHAENCRFSCPTEGCTVTYDGKTFSHSSTPSCVYWDSSLYCEECGYLTYNEEEDDYFHK